MAVFELRRDKRIQDVRMWLNSRLEGGLGSSDAAVNDLWEAVESFQPKTVPEVIKGTVGNIPLPIPAPVNPASMALAGKAIADAHRFQKRHRLLVFLHEMRQKSKVYASAQTKTPSN